MNPTMLLGLVAIFFLASSKDSSGNSALTKAINSLQNALKPSTQPKPSSSGSGFGGGSGGGPTPLQAGANNAGLLSLFTGKQYAPPSFVPGGGYDPTTYGVASLSTQVGQSGISISDLLSMGYSQEQIQEMINSTNLDAANAAVGQGVPGSGGVPDGIGGIPIFAPDPGSLPGAYQDQASSPQPSEEDLSNGAGSITSDGGWSSPPPIDGGNGDLSDAYDGGFDPGGGAPGGEEDLGGGEFAWG